MAPPMLALVLAGAAAATPSPDFDAWWNFGDPAGTEARFRARLGELEPGHDRDYRLQLLTQVARTQGLQGAFEAAQETLAAVTADNQPPSPVVTVRHALERGRVYNSSGDRARAVPQFRAAYEAAQEAGLDHLAVDAAHMLAIALPGDHEQLQWNHEAMRLAESSPDPRARKWLGSLLNNLAWTHHGAGRFEAALELFEKAQAFREEQGAAEPIRIARWSVARCLRSLGRTQEALAIQEALHAAGLASGDEDGYVHEELAELYLETRGVLAARPHFARAHALLAGDTSVEPARRERLRLLGAGS